MFNKKSLLLFLILAGFLSGCATIATKGALPTFSINGVSYIPLVSLCDAKAMNWEYDLITRNILIVKDNHKINLRVGERMVLVDGNTQVLRHPVDIYNGAVVVPVNFKEIILDPLFKEYAPYKKVSLVSLRIKKVIIDAGHGGKDPGAIGRSGSREKHIVLDIAKRLASLLKKEAVEVIMTRPVDNFISLEKRVDITNNSQADLFISIHANANRVKSLNGFEVYCISSDLNDYQRALYAAKSARFNLADYCVSYPTLDLKATLWDMVYTSNRAESVKLAQEICRSIGRNLDTRVIGTKSAHFMVLKGSRIPAVLIEVGFLTNSTEEGFLKNSYYRQKVAEGINEGLLEYARDTLSGQNLNN